MAIVADEKMTKEEVKTEAISDLDVNFLCQYRFYIILDIILVESESLRNQIKRDVKARRRAETVSPHPA
jgi:hypothetical protein